MRGYLLITALAVGAACSSSKRQREPEEAPAEAAEQVAPAALEVPAPQDTGALLTQVMVKAVEPAQARWLLADEMGKILERELLAGGEYRSAESDEVAGLRAEVWVTLSYDVIEPGKKRQEGAVFVALEAQVNFIDAGDDPEAEANVLIEKPLSRSEVDRANAILKETVTRGLQEVAHSLSAMEELRVADDAALLSALSGDGIDKDPELRAWALRLAGERRLEGAVEPAIAGLQAEHEAVSRAALAALVAIGDDRAVGPLTRRVDFKDHEQVRSTIEAVAALGGDEARAFLDFVATGHPDSQIQAQAREAIARTEPADAGP
jgi:hypothetical protein